MSDWHGRALNLADQLVAAGALEPAWRIAFERVPRHVFVPRFYRPDGQLVDGTDDAVRAEWLDAVYRDDSLTTELLTEPGSGRLIPTSSSTRPSLMATMLGLLDVHDGHTVLEIGTGTGYNAAIMSRRLGAGHVTSIDINPHLVDTARDRLASLDLHPRLATADGADGHPACAPYDRIIATCSIPEIPPSWVTQLADGGMIVADVRNATTSSLLILHRTSPGVAEGHFRSAPGHFMLMRPRFDDPRRNAQEGNFVFNTTGSRRSVTRISPDMLDDRGCGLMVAAMVPGLVQATTSAEPPSRGLRSDDGSWTRVNTDTGEVIQVGDRSLWTEIESAAGRWEQLRRPDPSLYRVTVSASDGQRTWLAPSTGGVLPLSGEL